MLFEYLIFWLMGAVGFFGWIAALVLALLNRLRLARIEAILKGSQDA